MEMSRDTIGKPRGIQPTERQGDPIVSNYINSCRRTSVRSLLASALVPLAAGAGSVEDVEQNYTSDASGNPGSLEWWIDRVPTPSQLTPSVDAPEISTPCVGIDNLLPLCERHHHLVHEGGWTLTMTAGRVATWSRPDGAVHHSGQTIDRTGHQVATGQPVAA
jgi:hypothetical protein